MKKNHIAQHYHQRIETNLLLQLRMTLSVTHGQYFEGVTIKFKCQSLSNTEWNLNILHGSSQMDE